MGILSNTQPTAQGANSQHTETSGILGDVVNAATGGVLNHVMGMVFGGAEDARQRKQQQALQDQQIQGAKDLSSFNAAQQLAQWNATSFPAQMEKIKEAQLSPGLIYGGTGAGGQITGGVPTQMPTGGQAANSAATTAANSQMALILGQQELMKAQTDQAEANAKLASVTADKTAGVDTTKTNAETQSLLQGINNAKAQEQLTKVQTDIANIQKGIQGDTYEDQVKAWAGQAKKIYAEGQSAIVQSQVDTETEQTKTKMIEAGLAQALANITLTNAQKNKTTAEATEANFKAGLAQAGISPDAPWYVKMLGDMLQKLGLNPITKAEGQ